jgi:hypothetical protein
MAVSIVFTVDSVATTSIDHSTAGAGDKTTVKTVYISLSGANNPVNNLRFYLDAKSGVYSGSKTAADDKIEIIGWGDGLTEAAFGGVQFNFNAISGFPSSSWGVYTDKSPTGGSTIRSGVGDSAANGILLPTTTSVTGLVSPAGRVPVTAGDIAFQMRIKVPSSVTTLGTRQFDIKTVFSYTS